ncbi:hypothetical protein V1290_005507 [Bradyrhizobium sp. AZCC 1578]
MLLSATEFELVPKLALCGVTLAGILAVFAVASGLFLLGRHLFERSRHWRSKSYEC